jgi:hypothetical protein
MLVTITALEAHLAKKIDDIKGLCADTTSATCGNLTDDEECSEDDRMPEDDDNESLVNNFFNGAFRTTPSGAPGVHDMDDLNRPVATSNGVDAFSECVGLHPTMHDDTTYTHECNGDRAPATQRMYPHAHINSNRAFSQDATNAASIDRQPLDTRN